MRRIFKRKQYEQTYGPIFSKICVHVYVEKGTTMSKALLSAKEVNPQTLDTGVLPGICREGFWTEPS